MNVFGNIKTGVAVQKAVIDTVRVWGDTYLAEVAAQNSWPRGSLPGFRSYATKLEMAHAAEDQMPSLIVVAPGTLDTPSNRSGKISVRWSVGVGCVVSGKDEESTYDLAQLYAAAIRTLLLQKSALGGFAQGVNFISERYDELDSKRIRSLGAGVCHFGVDVMNVTDANRGPLEPLQDVTQDPGDFPTVQSVDVDLEEKVD
jgi:hypothetical protein